MTAADIHVCSCGKAYPADVDPHEWKPRAARPASTVDTTSDRDTLTEVVLSPRWPDGGRLDGVTSKTAGMIADAILDSDWLAAHDRALVGQAHAPILASAERCQELLTKPSGDMTPDDWNELREHPLRFSGRELPKWLAWLRAVLDVDAANTHNRRERAAAWDTGDDE